jgi:hypothetical protein
MPTIKKNGKQLSATGVPAVYPPKAKPAAKKSKAK